MARNFLIFWLMALLYGSTPVFASGADANAFDIALLLPLDQPEFKSSADAVRRGFMAAASLAPEVRVKIYSLQNTRSGVAAAYDRATQDGAGIVVGPLSRDGVLQLAAVPKLKVPTLALNVVDAKELPANLYLFGLKIESGVRQAADFAYGEGRRRAYVVSGESGLSKRIRSAFVDEWRKLGGEFFDLPLAATDPEALTQLKSSAAAAPDSMVFLALDGVKARLVRPFLDPGIAVYATFLVYDGADNALANIDIDGVRFPELPWLVEPDHPAVMAYPPSKEKSADLDRLYALGIDAFRLANGLGSAQPKSLDGVTGAISLEGRVYSARFTPAVVLQGQVQAIKPDKK